METSDADVLEAIAFSTGIGGPAGKVELTDLTIKLDDTTFNGSGSYNLADSGIVFNLQGDQLNADRYLPPKAEGEAEEAPTNQETAALDRRATCCPWRPFATCCWILIWVSDS